MKTKNSHNTPQVDNVTLASGVASLLDANDALERKLIEAAKTVSTSFKMEVRQTGEKVYRHLDVLNGRLEAFLNPKQLDKPKAKQELRQTVLQAEAHVNQLAKPLRDVRGLDGLTEFHDEWTEIYLDFASKLGKALDPQDFEAEEGDVTISKAA